MPEGRRDLEAERGERRLARGAALALPAVTIVSAMLAAATLGAPIAILILAAGVLLGVISLFWASLRILSGDAALSPELEALDATAHAVDAMASRKKMLLRALKDLDNERALGKLEEEDYEQLSHTYRGELKETLVRIDASLAPYRAKAENAARAHLDSLRLTERSDVLPTVNEKRQRVASAPEGGSDDEKDLPSDAKRVSCTNCLTSNEVDATFCKKCGDSLASRHAEAAESNDFDPIKQDDMEKPDA